MNPNVIPQTHTPYHAYFGRLNIQSSIKSITDASANKKIIDCFQLRHRFCSRPCCSKTIILHRIEKDKQLLVATYTSKTNARVHRIQTNAVRTVDKSCALDRNPVAQGVPTIAANLGIESMAQLL